MGQAAASAVGSCGRGGRELDRTATNGTHSSGGQLKPRAVYKDYLMILSEVLPFIHCAIELKVDNNSTLFPGSQVIPLNFHRHVVESISLSAEALVITVRSSTESRQLEQYGYSFEDGV
jgi:hypothetical protein